MINVLDNEKKSFRKKLIHLRFLQRRLKEFEKSVFVCVIVKDRGKPKLESSMV